MHPGLIPRPFFGGRGEEGLACACARSPQKNLGESDIIAYYPYTRMY